MQRDIAGILYHATREMRERLSALNCFFPGFVLSNVDLGRNERRRKRSTQRFIEHSLSLVEKGSLVEARLELLKASIAAGDTPDCHHAIEMACVQNIEYDKAIEEWLRCLHNNTKRAKSESLHLRIDSLRRKINAPLYRPAQ